MRIAEIFYSIQGEGALAGVPSVFIRTSGCNLRCVWCDTPYTSWDPGGENRSLAEVLSESARYPARHVVVTGGEPLLAAAIEALTTALKQQGYHVTVETAATVFKPIACDLVSLSPKLANSTPWRRQKGRFARLHEHRRLNFDVMQRFIDGYDYQLKFVVGNKEQDLPEIRMILERLKGVKPENVFLMAQARTKRELERKSPWVVEMCKANGFRYSPRLQIDLYGNRRGT